METGGLCSAPLPKVSEAVYSQDNLDPFSKTQEINQVLGLATTFSQWLHISITRGTFVIPDAQTNEISVWVEARVLVIFNTPQVCSRD